MSHPLAASMCVWGLSLSQSFMKFCEMLRNGGWGLFMPSNCGQTGWGAVERTGKAPACSAFVVDGERC